MFNLKYCHFILLLIYTVDETIGQSPFNYGQNKRVYFISSELRSDWVIRNVYSVDHYPENETGGMSENWSLMTITFDSAEIANDWTPIYGDTGFVFNLDSVLLNCSPLNGIRYELNSENLSAYGGGGYGSFDWCDIFFRNKHVSLVATTCLGHCGIQKLRYSQNNFDNHGRIISTIHYPEVESDFDAEMHSESEWRQILTQSLSDTTTADTIINYYDRKGLLLNVEKEVRIKNKREVKLLFSYNNQNSMAWHQCFVGDESMEEFLKAKIGYLPEVVLFEIYRYGVFSFTLNNTDGKYYSGREIILER